MYRSVTMVEFFGAAHYNVVANWIRTNRLKGTKTSDGRYDISKEALCDFLRKEENHRYLEYFKLHVPSNKHKIAYSILRNEFEAIDETDYLCATICEIIGLTREEMSQLGQERKLVPQKRRNRWRFMECEIVDFLLENPKYYFRMRSQNYSSKRLETIRKILVKRWKEKRNDINNI